MTLLPSWQLPSGTKRLKLCHPGVFSFPGSFLSHVQNKNFIESCEYWKAQAATWTFCSMKKLIWQPLPNTHSHFFSCLHPISYYCANATVYLGGFTRNWVIEILMVINHPCHNRVRNELLNPLSVVSPSFEQQSCERWASHQPCWSIKSIITW